VPGDEISDGLLNDPWHVAKQVAAALCAPGRCRNPTAPAV